MCPRTSVQLILHGKKKNSDCTCRRSCHRQGDRTRHKHFSGILKFASLSCCYHDTLYCNRFKVYACSCAHVYKHALLIQNIVMVHDFLLLSLSLRQHPSLLSCAAAAPGRGGQKKQLLS